MTETKTDPRAWEMPAEPEGVTKVRDADGAVWQVTDQRSSHTGNRFWEPVPKSDDPIPLTWRALLRHGPLTEVAD